MEIDLARQSLAIPVRDQHDVGDARRQVVQAAKAVGFDETASGRAGIISTEIAGNLVKHAGGGLMIMRTLRARTERGLELMSIDDGPGMDFQRCLQDGYSTAGSPGTGLGAVNRLATHLDVYSLRGKGTVLTSELWPGKRPAAAYEVGAICLPVAGERLCGDGWDVRISDTGFELLVSDGLGHGPIAAEATDMALGVFARQPDLAPEVMLERMHEALRSTRGAAAMTARLNAEAQTLICAGIGNIAGYVLSSAKPRGVVSMNGIVGHQTTKVKAFSYECAPNNVVILHSDGLTTHWKIEDFPGLITRSASLIAGVIYKHCKRGKDDATVVVVRRR